MPADKNTERLTAAEETFRKLVLDQYELEEDFVSTVCGFFRKAAEPLAESAAAPKRTRAASSKPKKQRKKSAYNVYVREMMKTEDIQKLNHKEKMGAIATLWKSLSLDDRTPYTDMAKVENDEASSPEDTE